MAVSRGPHPGLFWTRFSGEKYTSLRNGVLQSPSWRLRCLIYVKNRLLHSCPRDGEVGSRTTRFTYFRHLGNQSKLWIYPFRYGVCECTKKLGLTRASAGPCTRRDLAPIYRFIREASAIRIEYDIGFLRWALRLLRNIYRYYARTERSYILSSLNPLELDIQSLEFQNCGLFEYLLPFSKTRPRFQVGTFCNSATQLLFVCTRTCVKTSAGLNWRTTRYVSPFVKDCFFLIFSRFNSYHSCYNVMKRRNSLKSNDSMVF